MKRTAPTPPDIVRVGLDLRMQRQLIVLFAVAVLTLSACRPRPVLRPDVDALTAGLEVQLLASERVMPLIERTRLYYEENARWPDEPEDLLAPDAGTTVPSLDLEEYESLSFEPQVTGELVLTFVLEPFDVMAQGPDGEAYRVTEAAGTIDVWLPEGGGDPEAEIGWTTFVAERVRDGMVIDLSVE